MMRRIPWIIPIVLASVAPAFATSITIGGSGLNNVFPFGCGPSCGPTYLGEYQQIYSSTAFSGPITINQIAFETVGSPPHSITDVFTLSLGTTFASPGSPGTTYVGNRRPDFTTVFSGAVTVPATGSGAFDFIVNLTTPFTYAPSNPGNLLLDVFIVSDSDGGTEFVAGSSLSVGRLFNVSGTGAATPQGNYGLLTRFSDEVAATVPEPTSLMLLATGLAVGARRWRKQRTKWALTTISTD
jgi:PEP-CTERM motif